MGEICKNECKGLSQLGDIILFAGEIITKQRI